MRALIRKIEEPAGGEENSRIGLKKRTRVEIAEEFWERMAN
jgi:hypothetical protein